MAFFQDAPQLGNQYDGDPMLSAFLARIFGADELAAIEPELRELGDLAAGKFRHMQLADLANEPVLTQWDPWGRRIDHIEVTQVWKEAAKLAAERGLVASGYDAPLGARARVQQFAKIHVISPSLDVYSCPLAMTDGAARTLLDSGNQALVERALPHLLSRDPATAWTSGQWMTERTGGSDVGLSETVAKKAADGSWRLYGTKWFTSATTAEMALTLARPEGNALGSRGLALFFVPVRDDAGRLSPGISVNRLKNKLGTKKVPTAELTLDGAPAILVGTESDGVRAITPMLSITRTWNAVCSVSGMRRAIGLARDYAGRRKAFGALLRDKPLHADTLAGLEAEYAGAFMLAFRAVSILGKVERDGDDADDRLLRALTPIAKLTTAKQAVACASEAIESCGGAGYIEDTGLPRLLADAQVLPIWEGTTNVLSLDTLRALGKGGAIEAVVADARSHLAQARDGGLAAPAAAARDALDHAVAWAAGAMGEPERLEAGARRVAMTLGRSLELSYLCAHAQWCLDQGRGGYAAAAARRFARNRVDLVDDIDRDDTRALLG